MDSGLARHFPLAGKKTTYKHLSRQQRAAIDACGGDSETIKFTFGSWAEGPQTSGLWAIQTGG